MTRTTKAGTCVHPVGGSSESLNEGDAHATGEKGMTHEIIQRNLTEYQGPERRVETDSSILSLQDEKGEYYYQKSGALDV